MTAEIGFIVPVQLGADGDQEGIDYEAPGLVLDIKPPSGPIASKTTYSIDETDINAFLLQMRQRRYAIARAGARDWTLQRDLQHVSRWTETFWTPTWMDYLRMNHRLSPADQEIARTLAALHQGETLPQTELAIERPARARSRVQPIARM